MARFEPPVSLPVALDAAIAEMRGERRLYKPVYMGEEFTFEDRQDLAAYLAGTSDRKSQTYRTAMRNIQRWQKGRTPTPQQLYKLEQYEARRLHQDVIVDFNGDVLVSTDERWREIYGVVIRETDLETPERFEVAFFLSYGLPGASIIRVGLLRLKKTGGS